MYRRGGSLLLLLALVAGNLPGGSGHPGAVAPTGSHAALPGVEALQAPLLPASPGSSLLAGLLVSADLRSGPAGSDLQGPPGAGSAAAGSIRPTPDPTAVPTGLSSTERMARAGLLTSGATTVPPPHSD